jgi:putative phage-type endonuclease
MTDNFDRTKGVGGSDIPVLLGLSKWKSPLDLYLEKIGEATENSIKENQKHILGMGKTLEPYVIQSFEEDTGDKVTRQQERILHPKYNFLWGTIDGVCGDKVIEIKTTSSYVDSWKESVPQYVLAQVAYYANLLNTNGAKIVVLFRDNGEIRTYAYERDIEAEGQIITSAVDFWDMVGKRTPPTPTNYEEAQTIFKNVTSDKKVIASTQDIAAIERMHQLKKELDEKEKEYDTLKTSICAKLGDAPVLVDEQGHCLATWKERNSSRVSVDTLKNLHPAIYSECLLKSTIRNFSLKAYA